MLQVAIFVDAGYLYAEGSALLAGMKVPRAQVQLVAPRVLDALFDAAQEAEPEARLLRVYWYDGLMRGGGLNPDQRAIADEQNVKCRFGTINSRGEQKGVDSLIVTDLIELARNQAISDALILSGDEDIRIGVQVAQTFGVRVHLVGVQPLRRTQSPALIGEADTLREWDRDRLATLLIMVGEPTYESPPTDGELDPRMLLVIARRIDALSLEEAQALNRYADANRDLLPGDFDRPMLAMAGGAVERELTQDERRSFRGLLVSAIRRVALGDTGADDADDADDARGDPDDTPE